MAREELLELTATLSSVHMNGDDAAIAGKTLEDGSATYEKIKTNLLAARPKKFIEQLEAILIRIQNKRYGICMIRQDLNIFCTGIYTFSCENRKVR